MSIDLYTSNQFDAKPGQNSGRFGIHEHCSSVPESRHREQHRVSLGGGDLCLVHHEAPVLVQVLETQRIIGLRPDKWFFSSKKELRQTLLITYLDL